MAALWDDITIGDVVVDLEVRVDERQLFLFSAATHNPHRIHYDLPYARSEGYSALLVHGPLQRALMARFVMEWAGGSAQLRRLRLQHRGSAFVGAPIRFRAEVLAKSEDENDPSVGRVELGVLASDSDGRALMPGSAWVSMHRPHS